MIDLDNLMRLREAATPGPWDTEYRKGENGMYGQDVFTSENGETIATIAWYPKPLGNGVTSTYRADNAAYIVAACNAVPELVARIRELEAQIYETVGYIVSNESQSMIDCRICFFEQYCERKKDQWKSDPEMCRKAIMHCVTTE